MLSATALGQMCTAIAMVILARSGTVARFGQAMSVIAVVALLCNFLNFGSNSLSVRELSSGREDQTEFAQRLKARTGITFACALIATAILAIWRPNVASIQFAPALLLLLATSQMCMVPLIAERRFMKMGVATVADKATMLVATVIVVGIGSTGPEATAAVMALGALISTVAAVLFWPPSFRAALWAKQGHSPRPRNPWRGSRHFGLSSTLVALTSADVAILSGLGGAYAAGIYAAVSRWTQPLNLVATSYSQTQYPLIAAASDTRSAWYKARAGRILLIPLGIGVILILAFANDLVVFLLGERYASSSQALRLLAVGTLGVAVNQTLLAFLNARHFEARAAKVVSLAVATQLIVLVLLARPLGAEAAALAYCVSQYVLLAGLCWSARICLKSPDSAGPSLPGNLPS
jgi:O-antigen/teichoic acid export membrane protein